LGVKASGKKEGKEKKAMPRTQGAREKIRAARVGGSKRDRLLKKKPRKRWGGVWKRGGTGLGGGWFVTGKFNHKKFAINKLKNYHREETKMGKKRKKTV